MTTKKSVLGKGLGALLNTSIATPANIEKAKEMMDAEKSAPIEPAAKLPEGPSLVDVSDIKANSNQPRRVFKDEELKELADSIKENGVIQPLIVTFDEEDKKFELIAGERRLRASKIAGLSRVPVVIKRVTKKDKALMAIIENVQRSDLNCVEEALAYFQLMEEFKLTQEEVAKKVGKTRSSIANFLRILKLPKEVLIMLQKEVLSFGHAKVLGSVDNDKAVKLAKLAAEESWSVRKLEGELKSDSSDSDKKTPSSKRKLVFNERLDAYKQKLERKTGFHYNIKSGKNGKGELVIKFNDEKEFNRIFEFLMD